MLEVLWKSAPVIFAILTGIGLITYLVMTAIERLRRVHQQFVRAMTKLTQAITDLKDTAPQVIGIKEAIMDSNGTMAAQRRMAASADLILRLETDEQWLDARRAFAKLRELSVKGHNRFAQLLETRTALSVEFSNYEFGHLATPLTAEVAPKVSKAKSAAASKKTTSQEDTAAADDRFELYEATEIQYQRFINYLNMLEHMSIQIQRGVYDADTLRKWHRAAYVRNVAIAQPAIKMMRQFNEQVYVECEMLARAWSRTSSEYESLGGKKKCTAVLDAFNEELAKKNLPQLNFALDTGITLNDDDAK